MADAEGDGLSNGHEMAGPYFRRSDGADDAALRKTGSSHSGRADDATDVVRSVRLAVVFRLTVALAGGHAVTVRCASEEADTGCTCLDTSQTSMPTLTGALSNAPTATLSSKKQLRMRDKQLRRSVLPAACVCHVLR